MTEASPDLAVRMLDGYQISGQEKFTIQPSALEIIFATGEAEWLVRTLCGNARVIGDVMLLAADALQGG